MNISSSKSPYLLQIERSNKPKATYGNRFRIALKTEKAESQAKDSATDGLDSKDTLQTASTPSYTLTKEMEALFREMYGKPYKEDDPYKLEEESDEDEKLSVDDAEIASRKNGLFFRESTRLDKDTRVVSFADFMVENGYFSSKEELMDYLRTGNMPNNDGNQIIEVNGKEYDISKLDIISPENFDDWYTPEFSPAVELGIKYMKSCFDFSNSWDYGKLTAAEDFTGMSDAEKYKAIYEKYQHCYGENFYYGNAIDYPMPPSEYDDYNKVIRRFEKEVSAVCGNVEQARREALYGDKSDREVRQEIIDSYDLSDGMSFREFYQMTYDIWKIGLDGGLHNHLDLLFYDLNTTGNSHMLTRENFLDTKVSGKHFSELQKFFNSGVLPEYRTTLNQISAECGSSSGGVSVSSVSNSLENNFQWIKL